MKESHCYIQQMYVHLDARRFGDLLALFVSVLRVLL